jgi:hypothetical protein
MTFGPYKDTQALYYATFEGNGGSIRRVAYTEGNQPPVADVKTVGDNYGDADAEKPDFQIDFSASGTRDPDGETDLTYNWDFGDQSPRRRPPRRRSPTLTRSVASTPSR